MIITAGHTIKEIRLGGKVIGKVMQGDRVVYQRFRLNITPALSFAAAGGNLVLSIDCAAWQTWTLTGVPAGWRASTTSGKGPAGPVLTAPNNTSTQAVSGVITVTSEGKTATCSLSQAAGAKVYEEIAIDRYSYSVIPAGGGAASPSLTYAQEWTWNGVSGSGGRLGSGAAVSYSGTGVDASTGAVSAASKGTTVSGQTTVTTATATVTMNEKSATTSATVYQAANGWADNRIELRFDTLSGPNDKTVGAGLSTTPLFVRCYRRYTSGEISGAFDVTSGATFTVSGTGFSISGTSVVAADRGTTAGAARSGTISVRYGNLSTNATITQAANAATTITYGTPSVSLAVADIPAAGGSVASGTVTYSQSRTQNYTSGSTAALSALTSGGTVSYSPAVSAGSLGTTVKARTSVGNLNVTVTMNGKVGVGSASVYQAANAVTGYSDIAIHGVVYNAIPYTGGTVAPSIVAVHTKNFSSGANASEESGFPPGYSLHFSISGSVFSIDAGTGSVSVGANAGTTARSGLIVVVVKDPSGKQVASKAATVRQEAKPGPVTVTLSASVSGGQVQLKINPRSYDALSVHLMGYDTYGNVWSEVRNIGVGVTSDPFYPKEATSGFAADASIESVDNGSLSPYTTENAIYRWGENTFE